MDHGPGMELKNHYLSLRDGGKRGWGGEGGVAGRGLQGASVVNPSKKNRGVQKMTNQGYVVGFFEIVQKKSSAKIGVTLGNNKSQAPQASLRTEHAHSGSLTCAPSWLRRALRSSTDYYPRFQAQNVAFLDLFFLCIQVKQLGRL